MRHRKMNRFAFLLIPATLFFLLLFFFLFGSHVSAEAGNLNDMKGYETVLIKEGDTLSSVAATYADEYSYFTEDEYREAVITLNNLSSEYIQAGNYLLLPQYR